MYSITMPNEGEASPHEATVLGCSCVTQEGETEYMRVFVGFSTGVATWRAVIRRFREGGVLNKFVRAFVSN
jgi:hypothetical protein